MSELIEHLRVELAILQLSTRLSPATILMRPDAIQALRELCPTAESSNPWFIGFRIIERKWLDKPWQILPEPLEE